MMFIFKTEKIYIMPKPFLIVLLALFINVSYAQDAEVQQLNKIVDSKTGLDPLHFLASDDLKGRSPKRPEIHVAAGYIASQFKKSGIKQVNGTANYFQSFDLGTISPATDGSLSVGDARFQIGKQLLQVRGQDVSINAPIVYAGFGNKEDIANTDVKGKIVITKLGNNDSSNVRQGVGEIKNKELFFAEKGAVALIEIFWQKDMPWSAVVTNLSRERSAMNKEPIPVFILNPDDSAFLSKVKNATQASVTTSGNKQNKMAAKNVMGWVQGTDAGLRKEYVVLSAHYDHIGVGPAVNTDGRQDSIFNGARDNAIGVTAVIDAAKYFAKHPPRRSVLFLLYTAEEMGLLGSRYFSEHSPIPINQMVFNLNCDNGGYNDTTIATVIGLGRTSADNDMKDACSAYNITAIADPVPELGLFDRSDNVNLAVKGVPAPTFGMGIRGFDDEVKKYYHQPADEIATFNLRYALTFVRSYILAAKKIADNPVSPSWQPGDKYEAAWKALYKK